MSTSDICFCGHFKGDHGLRCRVVDCECQRFQFHPEDPRGWASGHEAISHVSLRRGDPVDLHPSIADLAVAGALIATEIDRRQSVRKSERPDEVVEFLKGREAWAEEGKADPDRCDGCGSRQAACRGFVGCPTQQKAPAAPESKGVSEA